MVDYPENQLNLIGLEQACEAADRMEYFVEEGEWGLPDLIISSPLQRAQQTALPFRERYPDIAYRVVPEAGEMKFGSWDNVKVIKCIYFRSVAFRFTNSRINGFTLYLYFCASRMMRQALS